MPTIARLTTSPGLFWGVDVRDVLAVPAPTQSFAVLLDMNSPFEEFV
jgi:hypothetical protein